MTTTVQDSFVRSGGSPPWGDHKHWICSVEVRRRKKDEMSIIEDLQPIAPASFVEPNNKPELLEVEQSHRLELKESVRDYWARLSILPDGKQTILRLDAKEGRKEAMSRLTLSND